MAGIEQGRGWVTFLQGFDYIEDRVTVVLKVVVYVLKRGATSAISKVGAYVSYLSGCCFYGCNSSTGRLVKVEFCILVEGRAI